MDEPPVRSRWRTGIGVVLGLVLATLLVGRATGVVGGGGQILADAGSEGTPAATPSSPATVGQTRATSAPRLSPARPDEADRPARPSWKKQRPSAPDGLATQMPDGEDLAAAVQDLLGTRPDREPDAVPLEFRVSSFNVLGASHTTARGNKARYASGTARMPGSVRLLQDVGADVVGFQEYELVQHQAFTRLTGGRYDVYPGASLGRGPLRNSVAWRQDTWELVDARTIPIPYFRGNRVPMPYVLLRHRESAQPVYFINIHNPASNKKRGNNERWRDLATKMEITLADRLARQVGVPVVLMGDFNERQEAFCRVTGAGLVAANGGAASPCRPPANAGIDWIFGTRDITFSDYQRLDSPLVNRLTDHPVLTATARVGG